MSLAVWHTLATAALTTLETTSAILHSWRFWTVARYPGATRFLFASGVLRVATFYSHSHIFAVLTARRILVTVKENEIKITLLKVWRKFNLLDYKKIEINTWFCITYKPLLNHVGACNFCHNTNRYLLFPKDPRHIAHPLRLLNYHRTIPPALRNSDQIWLARPFW